MGGFRLGIRQLYWGYVMTIFGCRERFEARCHFRAAPGPGTCFGTCPEPALNLQPRNPKTRPNLPQTLLQLKTPELTLFGKNLPSVRLLLQATSLPAHPVEMPHPSSHTFASERTP